MTQKGGQTLSTDKPCDVCVMVNNDHTPKPTAYCSLCKANLCSDCRTRYDLRGIAAIKSLHQKIKNGWRIPGGKSVPPPGN